MADEQRVQQLEDRVEVLGKTLAEAVRLIQKIAEESAKSPMADQINASNIATEARYLAERARQSGIDVKRS